MTTIRRRCARIGLVKLGLLLVVAGAGCLWDASAQQRLVPPDTLGTQLLLSTVTFSGGEDFSNEVLRLRVRTTPNRRFLGIPGLTWWNWLYRLGSSGTLGKRLGGVLIANGEPPAYLDAAILAADAERLQHFYAQEGFREAQVVPRIDTTHAGKRASVTFEILAGEPTYFRQVTYAGLEALDSLQQVRLARGSFLKPRHLDPAEPLRYEAEKQRYSGSLLLEERRRMLAFLRDQGFAAVTRDSIKALLAAGTSNTYDVTIQTSLGPRYRFGPVHFEVQGSEVGEPLRADTSRTDVTWKIQDEHKLDKDLLLRALRFQPGQWYNQTQLGATKRRLEATGVFSFTDIVSVPPSGEMTPPDSVPVLAHRIRARTRERHQMRFETFMVQRTGLLGIGNELGAGLGVSYQNANLFGSGETFELSTTGSLAADIDSTLFSAAQAEVSTSLGLPYLVFPFQNLDRSLNLFQARTRFSLSLLTARREDLRLVIRGRGTARMRYEMQHTPTISSFVDLLDVSLSNPDTLSGFQTRFLNRILGQGDSVLVTDPVQRAQILEDYTQPQVNNALRYTLRSARVNPLRRERGYSYEAAVEMGGSMAYLLDRLAFTPDSLEGSLPGLPFFGGDTQNSRLVYRQYLRLVADLRQYKPLGNSAVFAWKLTAGIAHPIGQSEVIPFDRRFYSGGASSVRGWALRELGPGAASFSNDTQNDGATNLLGGDIKLEAGVELRQVALRNLFAADWILAFFIDTGNVWFGPRNPGFRNLAEGAPDGRFAVNTFVKELGVGSGVGLRTSWEYLIVRFDLGYRLYDPARPESGFFPNGLRKPLPYFGIGHAF